jgi:hypothetical protein
LKTTNPFVGHPGNPFRPWEMGAQNLNPFIDIDKDDDVTAASNDNAKALSQDRVRVTILVLLNLLRSNNR